MKQRMMFSMAILTATIVISGCAKGFESSMKADGLLITLTAGTYPLEKSDNALGVKVADATGKAITDASVAVRYFLPPLPGVTPVQYMSQAAPTGGAYALTASIPREGEWKVEVAVARPGRQPAVAMFSLDAR